MRLPTVPQAGCCRVCARPVAGEKVDYLCEDCERNPPLYDRAACALRFEGKARDMLLDFKFNRRIYLASDFADWLEAAIQARFTVPEIDVVIPVPTTVFHYWDRGYNQSEILAGEIARRIDRRLDVRSLARKGRPKRQSSLTEAERRENVKGTFAVRRPQWIRGRTILLVDDILTTGATLSAASAVLKAAGASRVLAATLARSVRS
ncbi:MAG: ComF family protein [Kiritimatiellae bacterium]|nr:ComF family protein [Kiritimatiellia bacterium]